MKLIKFLTFILIYLVSGCATVGTPINWDAAKKIKIGMSPAETIEIMGEPSMIINGAGNSHIYSWQYVKPEGLSAHVEFYRLPFSNGKVSILANAAGNMSGYPASVVPVDVTRDEFADRYEFGTKTTSLGFAGYDGYFSIIAVVEQGIAGPVVVAGTLFYRAPWRYYDRAILKGGESVDALFSDRRVISCASPPCNLGESFRILPTEAQIAKYAEDGFLKIQIRSSETASATIINIPVDQLAAIRDEVSKYKKEK